MQTTGVVHLQQYQFIGPVIQGLVFALYYKQALITKLCYRRLERCPQVEREREKERESVHVLLKCTDPEKHFFSKFKRFVFSRDGGIMDPDLPSQICA